MLHGPVMIDVLGTELTADDRELLLHPAAGGVILFSRNFSSPKQLYRLVKEIHELRSPQSFEELRHSIESVYENVSRVDDVLRAAMDSPLGDTARRAQMPARLRFIEGFLVILAPGLEEPARSRLVRLMLILTSSGAQRMLSAAGLDAHESADDAMWAIQTIIEAETAKT